jgi:membrane-associated phospholipid phosphatase
MTDRKIAIIALLTFTSLNIQAQDRFPYHVSKKDWVILPIGAVAFFGGSALYLEKRRNLSMNEIESLRRKDINRLDRIATYQWDRSADHFSDITLKTMVIAPLALAVSQLIKKKWRHTATIGLMYAEVHFLTTGVTSITKALAQRTRPYLYNLSLSVEERFNAQGNGAPIGNTSFYSGHTASTFAAAVLLSKTYTDIYGKGGWGTVIWSGTLLLASATAYTRMAAGEHFPTDVIVGAVVGSAIGYSIPLLHKLDQKKIEMSFFPGYFNVAYKL